MIQGVDVSKWQGTIDWQKAASKGARFAILKATEASGYKDPSFPANYAGAKEQGLIVGAYHFFRATVSGESQAANVERTLNGYELDLPVMLDVELFDGVDAPLTTSRLQAMVRQLEGYQGYAYPGIYTSVGLWNPHVLQWSGWKNCPLWVAHWYVDKPRLPRDWTEYTIWQYRIDDGEAWGVQSSGIDLDQWNESVPFPGDQPPDPDPDPDPEPGDKLHLTITASLGDKRYSGRCELDEFEI